MTRLINGRRVGEWVADRVQGFFEWPVAEAIGLERDGKIVAGVIYEHWNGKSVHVHLAIEGPVTREFLWVIADYPFRQLKAYKLIAPILATNARMVKLALKLGFRREASIQDAHPDGNILLFTMLERDCRLLKGQYGKRCPSPAVA